MRKFVVSLALVVAVAGCGSSVTGQEKNDIKQIQPVVAKCLPKGSLLSHAGRQAILGCIAPAGHKAAFERCANRYLSVSAFATKGRRAKTYQGLFICWKHNR